MPGQFSTAVTITGPAIGAFAVTPDDDADLAQPVRAVTVGTAGALAYVSWADDAVHTTGALPAGTYPLLASRILATGTTATDLTGWV